MWYVGVEAKRWRSNTSFTTKFKKRVLPVPNIYRKFREEGDFPPPPRPLYPTPLGGIGKRNIIFLKAHEQEIRIQNSGIKIKIANPFSFLLKIYSALQNSQITVYLFAGGNLLRDKTKGGKMSSREKSSEVDLTNQLPPRH